MRKTIASLLLAALILVPSVGFAGDPMNTVKTATDRVLATIKNKNLTHKERVEKIYSIIDELVDWKLVSRSVLGIHWRKITPEQRRQFVKLFSEFAKAPYSDKFEKYSGEKITYDGERIEGRYADVMMRISMKNGQNVKVLCRMVKEGNKWFVYDICIEGVSMLNNYRVQINDILVNSSFSNLINILKKKMGKS